MAKNFYGLTDTGRQRTNNEDTFIAEVMYDDMIAACVIDGVGGYSGGEVAAQIARDTILEHLRNRQQDITTMLKEAVARANVKIYSEKKESKENAQMACVVTLALVDVPNNKFYYAHVGDTRLYLLRDKSLVKVTKDHSFVGFLEDSGRLSEEAAMRHPKRNEINKALGFDGEITSNAEYIESGDSPFLPGDMLLLCSDGLTDMISNGAITTIVTNNKSLPDKAKALVNAANDAGGKDNITVVLVENDKDPMKHEATRPAVTLKKNDNMKSEQVNLAGSNDDRKHHHRDKSTSGVVKLLSFLLLLVVAALVWLLLKDYGKTNEHERQVAQQPAAARRNAQEQAFIDSINNNTTGEVFVLNVAPGQPLYITDTISITKDSLHIMGNGVTLKGDSSLTTTGFSIGANSRYVLLDSLTLENFNIGITAQTPGLHLRNVQFKNCKIPVQYQFGFPANTAVSGGFADTLFRFPGSTQNY